MLDFQTGNSSRFGNSSAPQAGDTQSGGRRELPKAKAWLNIGYVVSLVVDGQPEDRFVSLPVGIPLDTMEPIQITSRNTEFAQFQAARNDLLAQIKEAAANLKPGEEVILCAGDNGLAVQLRHVNDPAAVPAADDSNPFAAKLTLIGDTNNAG